MLLFQSIYHQFASSTYLIKKNIFIFLLNKNNKFKSQSYNINSTKFIKPLAFYFLKI